jgi:3-dehydroquinate dehydratase II
MARARIEVLHGVNLGMLGLRDPAHYGSLTLPELEAQIEAQGAELGLSVSCFQTDAESEYVRRLHALRGEVDGLILNPGAWTHYAWAIHDALETTGLPAVEVHLSDVLRREAWRQVSVIGDLCVATVSGKGADGYRDALVHLREQLNGHAS